MYEGNEYWSQSAHCAPKNKLDEIQRPVKSRDSPYLLHNTPIRLPLWFINL